MTKNHKFLGRLRKNPLVRRVLERDWSFSGADKERGFVLLAIPPLALTLVLASTFGIAIAHSRSNDGDGLPEVEVASFESAIEETEVLEPEEAVDPVVEAISLWGTPDIAAILAAEFPDSEWSLDGDTYTGLTWFGPGPRPTEDELLALWVRVGPVLANQRAVAEQERLDQMAVEKERQEARAADPSRQALVEMIDYKALFGPGPQYDKILQLHYPGAEWSLNGSSYSGLTWIRPGTKPTRAELDALWDATARHFAAQLPLSDLQARAGVSETEEYLDGALVPKGYSDDGFVASPATCRQLPQVPSTGGGSPVGSIEIFKDPTGSQNFEQLYGVDLTELGCRIADAHGYFGGKYSLGLGLDGDSTLMWYSSQVDAGTVRGVLEGMGAFRTE